MTNYDLILETLYRYGTRRIFVYPGHTTIALLDKINRDYKDKLQLVVASSEQEAMAAADAYARLQGLGAVIVTFGVGSLSTANFAVNSYVSRSPVVIISGRPAAAERRSNFVCSSNGNLNSYIGAFSALGIPSFDFTSVESFQGLVEFARTESRPVYVEIEPDTGTDEARELLYENYRTLRDPAEKLARRFTHWMAEDLIDYSLPGPLDIKSINQDISHSYIVYDVGESVFAASQLVPLLKYPNTQVLTPIPWVSMGFALPAAVGVANYGGEVIAITGDGSFRLSMLSLTTIARYRLNVKIILIDNNGFETEKYLSDDAMNANYNQLSLIDYPRLVDSMGIRLYSDLNDMLSYIGPSVFILKRDKASPRMEQFCLDHIRSSI